MMPSRLLRIFSVLLFAAGLSACATAPTDPTERAEFERLNDPLEPANRVVFEFNQIVDKILLKPAAQVYKAVVPDFAQQIVSNVLYNAGEPVRMANAALQGRVTDAHNILNRFIANTVGGLGGIADVASESGLGPINADFGQTMHSWGFPEGPYLVLPILGPSNPRDAIGFAADSMADPWPFAVEEISGVGDRNRYIISNIAATAVDKRSKVLDAMDSLEKGSLDFYAQLRSVSRQYRHKQLGISEVPTHDDFDAFDETPSKPVKKAKKKRAAKKAASAAPASAMQPATPIAASQPAPQPEQPSLAMEPVMPLPATPPSPSVVPASAPAAAPATDPGAAPTAAPTAPTAEVPPAAPVAEPAPAADAAIAPNVTATKPPMPEATPAAPAAETKPVEAVPPAPPAEVPTAH